MLIQDLSAKTIRLSRQAVVRKEHFGGLIFNRDTGDIFEVDREAYTLFSIIAAVSVVNVNALLETEILYQGMRLGQKGIVRILTRFIVAGILEILPRGVLSEASQQRLQEQCRIKVKWPDWPQISAPETVHWAVTHQCGASCPDCYMERHKGLFQSELNTREALAIIDKIAAAGVFQLAIGGGEPLLRSDLGLIAAYAAEKGLIVHITTGCYEIDAQQLDELGYSIKSLQIGIKTDTCSFGNTAVEQLKTLVMQLGRLGVVCGANLVMSRSGIRKLDQSIRILTEVGFRRFTLLRYKPPVQVARWLEEKPDQHDLSRLEYDLADVMRKNSGLHIRIDCALAFLERRLNPQLAHESGIKGCTAADRILSVAPDGSVFPCSQLTGPDLKVGNLLQDDFTVIWNSQLMKRYRDFREDKGFRRGPCGKCKAKRFCGGCRVFAPDAYGSDPGCPTPQYRKGAVPVNDDYDIIDEIKEMIGFTSGGYPYASREQIEEWLEEAHDRAYPDWIRFGTNPLCWKGENDADFEL
ncbi:MAG: radical SAM protein [Bacillota bacterium]|nr:radical SAM protein [Bacillota bacterium]